MQDLTKREIIEIALVVIGIIVSFIFIFSFLPGEGDIVRYDCSISEINPDYPIKVKEECRKLRAENYLQKPK